MTRFDLTRGAVTILLAALASSGWAQTGNSNLGTEESGISEVGTIPAAPPGLPVLDDQRGAQGPVRSEPRPTTDASIRPFMGGPDIRNGLWETVDGNQVVNPNTGSAAQDAVPQQTQ
jgi:hypothetical protein